MVRVVTAAVCAGALILGGTVQASAPLMLAKLQTLPEPGSMVENEAPSTHEHWVALTREFTEHYQQGNLSEAAEAANAALKLALRDYGATHPFVADSLNKLGLVYEANEQLETAVRYYSRAVEILEPRADSSPAELGNALNNLANAYVQLEDYAQGEALHLRAMQARARAYGAAHPAVAQSAYNLGIVYQKNGQRDNAELFFKQAAALWSQAETPDELSAANSYTRLAEIYSAEENFSDAEQLYARALEIRRAQLGDQDLEVAESIIGVARASIKQEKYDIAGPLYLQALTIIEQQLGPDDPRVAVTLYSLANVYHIQAKIEDAWNRDFAARIATESSTRVNVLRGQIELRKNFVQQLYTRAEPLYVRAARIIETRFGNEHPTLKLIRSELTMLRGALNAASAKLETR